MFSLRDKELPTYDEKKTYAVGMSRIYSYKLRYTPDEGKHRPATIYPHIYVPPTDPCRFCTRILMETLKKWLC